ncbi:MAG: hypothetical protein KAS63_02810 [Candidatus Heimdallarchaeota archaeon]|nr:hypothetical protein [Candidatus Heimdallarchaeota archaeon]MCK4954266.1 hypothetical protein [Candidatus Heimdallarchaeota archaeon]
MRKPQKIQQEKEVEKLEKEEDFEEEKIVRINWVRIITLGFVTSIVFVLINLVIALLLVFGFEKEIGLVLYLMQYIVFGEAGVVIFLGACLGNFGQSVMVSKIKERFMGSDTITKDSFREATFNAFTYYSGGSLLLLYSMIIWQIYRIAFL